MPSMFERAKGFVRFEREAEDVHDFLGVVEIDALPEMGVLVLPNHVTAVLETTGTDFGHASAELRAGILEGWTSMLNASRNSIQVFVHRRPVAWDRPGGHLEHLRDQVEASGPNTWQRARMERFAQAIRDGELESLFPVAEVRMCLVIRVPLGTNEVAAPGSVDDAMYKPPRRSWRVWEALPSILGNRRNRLASWRARRNAAIRDLATAVSRLQNDAAGVPGLALRPLSGLETTQLLHLLWQGDRALDEWIGSDADLEALRRSAIDEIGGDTK
jgi:hypothetical protein